jgi:hypothetical protein
VIFLSVANSIRKKNHSPTVLQTDTRSKKIISRENITDGLNPSEFATVITDGYFVGNSYGKYRRKYSVGNYGMGGNCLATLSEIPTECIRWYSRR